MSLVLHDPHAPGTHALVIGVGAYSPNQWSLQDLSSPVVSACAFADWLRQEFRNPATPLASVDVLLSDPKGPSTLRDASGNPVTIERAALDRVTEAITAWKARCDEHFDNVAIFYFSGHGLFSGVNNALLLEGFGATRERTEDAIDIDGLRLGMTACEASRQLYLCDACRTEAAGTAGIGVPIIERPAQHAGSTPKQALFFATPEFQPAYGADEKVSLFTEAVLTSLTGAGWEDKYRSWTEWSVSTGSLFDGIERTQALRNEAGSPYQEARGGTYASFLLHQPPPGAVPSVPVLVFCTPEERTQEAELSILQGGVALQTRHRGLPHRWYTKVPAAQQCLLRADFVVRASIEEPCCICPPAYDKPLEVQP